MTQEKDTIRREIQLQYKNQSPEKQEKKTEKVIYSIINFLETQKYKHIALYKAMKDELSLEKLELYLKKKEKNIYYPEIEKKNTMIFKDIQGNIAKNIDIFIVPGRAFSRGGERLGRGKGYYDRFLAKDSFLKSLKIGVCFDFQIRTTLPTEKHDILLDKIIYNATV